MDCASGAAALPFELLIATHLSMCPLCRQEMASLEGIGGALLREIAPEPVDGDSLAAVLKRLDEPCPPSPPASSGERGDPALPAPLAGLVGGMIAELPWKRRSGIRELELLAEEKEYRTRLYMIDAGAAVPAHTHGGTEMTLVLKGAFHDQHGHYGVGDVAEADDQVDHSPIADEKEDCLCLAVTNAPLRLTGRFTRLLNPFIKI